MFRAGDEVVTTMHVSIPNVTPLMTRLKKVVVQKLNSAQTHTLFDNYAVTAKGSANNFDHLSVDDQADSTTFRLSTLKLGAPSTDPVFIATNAVDQYSIYSIATVEYQTAAGRRVAEVTTVRALPAQRSMSAASSVDVIATNTVSVDTRQDVGAATDANNTSKPSSSQPTMIIIAVCAVVGAAFVVAGTVFLVRSRIMRSRVQATKTRSRFYNAKPGARASEAGVFLGDVQLGSLSAAPRAHVGEQEPEAVAVSVARPAKSASSKKKGSKKLRVSKTSASAEVASPFAVPDDAAAATPARRTMKKPIRKMRNVASA